MEQKDCGAAEPIPGLASVTYVKERGLFCLGVPDCRVVSKMMQMACRYKTVATLVARTTGD